MNGYDGCRQVRLEAAEYTLVVTRGRRQVSKLSVISQRLSSTEFQYGIYRYKDEGGIESREPAKGQQLAYQPKISWRSGLRLSMSGASLYVNLGYTGERSTLDIYDILPAYLLTDFGVSYDFKISGAHFTINGVIKNITDEMYQSVKFYAMPGRNFQMSIQYKF